MAQPVTYICARCRLKFERDRKLGPGVEPRCDTCRLEVRRAQQRATWHRHGKAYHQTALAKRREQRAAVKAQQAVVEQEPATPVRVPRRALGVLPNGRRIVWMPDDSLG